MVANRFVLVLFFAFTSSACAIKVGTQTFASDGLDDATDAALFEFEATLPTFKDERSDLSLGVRFQTFDIEPDVRLVEVDLTWRRYLSDLAGMKPYFGLGVGQYKFESRDVIDTCPPGFICIPGSDEDFKDINTTTIAKGYNPHILLGALIPITGSDNEFLIELRHEFSKEDNTFDFRSTTIVAGIRFHF